MNKFLIILQIYFGINIFLAGYDYNHSVSFARTKKDYLVAWLHVIFWICFGVLFYVFITIAAVLQRIYKRTYINYGIATFITWYKFVYKGKEVKLYGAELKAMKSNVMINRMPSILKNWWLTFIEEVLKKQRKELFEKNGEVPQW